MTIHLPEDLESYIHGKVESGQFASEEDAVAEAVRRLKQWEQEQTEQQPPNTEAHAQPKRKPLWERVEELRKSVPAEEWAKLPTDGAAQLDHYIYGSPKRPIS